MKKALLSFFIVVTIAAWPTNALSRTLTVAVIDTGIDKSSNDKLCRFGHKSFVDSAPLVDSNGHGTHIAGLIRKEAGLLDYCIVSIKYYHKANSGKQNLANMIAAINYANNIKVDFINISGGGPDYDANEFAAIMQNINRGATVVVAAGNEGDNLDTKCNYYPACYSQKIIMVGNLKKTTVPSWVKDLSKYEVVSNFVSRTPAYVVSDKSNYGKRVTRWEVGTDVESTLPGGKYGKQTGTSQATGVATGKLIRERFL